MTWRTLPSRVRAVAERELTEKQLDAFKLELHGLGTRKIADRLGIERSSVQGRLAGAHRRLIAAGVRQDRHGNWYIEEEAEAA